jgi:hypothetical protein
MSKKAMKLALEALETELAVDMTNGAEVGEAAEKMYEAITAIKEVLAQPEQEPVAWGVFDGPNLHDMFFTEEEAQNMARLKGDGSVVKPLKVKDAP